MTTLETRTVGSAVIQEATAAPAVVIGEGAPQTVTMGQAKLALYDAGLLAHVDAVIAALPEPQRTRAQIEWTSRPTVDRDSPLVAMLGSVVGLNDAALDALFVTAKGL